MTRQDTSKIKRIIIHCSATTPTMDIGAAWIDALHRKEKGYEKIGYHFVIRRDGVIESGRSLDEVGAHTAGYNTNSIGICMVGGINKQGKAETNYTPEQWEVLRMLVKDLNSKFPTATIHGHNEFAAKDCPCFNVKEWVNEYISE